jgi:hypothetical protein
MDPIRIWYQSYVDEANGKTYWDRLRRHLPRHRGRDQRHHPARQLRPSDRRVSLRAGSDLQRGQG